MVVMVWGALGPSQYQQRASGQASDKAATWGSPLPTAACPLWLEGNDPIWDNLGSTQRLSTMFTLIHGKHATFTT
jgi:hypothetical protein